LQCGGTGLEVLLAFLPFLAVMIGIAIVKVVMMMMVVITNPTMVVVMVSFFMLSLSWHCWMTTVIAVFVVVLLSV
jgi:hypothetical protein